MYFCRFCLATQTDMQTSDAVNGCFEIRIKDLHNNLVREVQTNGIGESCGVKYSCDFTDHLSNFHQITGFHPDLLHDLLGGVVLVQLVHCFKGMFVNCPPPIASRETIGGNGHENHNLHRLLLALICSRVTKGKEIWEVLMELKYIACYVS